MSAADQMPGRPGRRGLAVRLRGLVALAYLLVAATAALTVAAAPSQAAPAPRDAVTPIPIPSGPFFFEGPRPFFAYDWTRTSACTVAWTLPDDSVPGDYTQVKFFLVDFEPSGGWIPVPEDWTLVRTPFQPLGVLDCGDYTITGEWKWVNPNDGTSGIVTHTHVLHYDNKPPEFAKANMLPPSRTTWRHGNDPILYFRFTDNMAQTCLTDVVVSNARGRPAGTWDVPESQFLAVQGFHQAKLITFSGGHLPIGKYTAKVRLYDTAGNVRWSKPVAFKVVK